MRGTRCGMVRGMILPVLAGAMALTTAGCIFVAGDRSESRSPTVGRQLQDLKVAHDTGAMSDAEYQSAKAKVLDCR